MNQIANKHHQSFEDIRQKNKEGQEFWSARDLQAVLNYNSWDKFKAVIRKAITACEKAGISPENHFSQAGKMVIIGSSAERFLLCKHKVTPCVGQPTLMRYAHPFYIFS